MIECEEDRKTGKIFSAVGAEGKRPDSVQSNFCLLFGSLKTFFATENKGQRQNVCTILNYNDLFSAFGIPNDTL